MSPYKHLYHQWTHTHHAPIQLDRSALVSLVSRVCLKASWQASKPPIASFYASQHNLESRWLPKNQYPYLSMPCLWSLKHHLTCDRQRRCMGLEQLKHSWLLKKMLLRKVFLKLTLKSLSKSTAETVKFWNRVGRLSNFFNYSNHFL